MEFTFLSPAGFQVEAFSVGALQCNCSLLWDPESKEGILVDPGGDFPQIRSRIEKNRIQIKAIIHTHAHFDHLGASEEAQNFTKAPLLLHPGDQMLWRNVPMQGEAFGFPLPALKDWDKNLEDEMTLEFGKKKLTTLFTPGHTPGSCCFRIEEILFSGDTLFSGSIGRTDLWGGDFQQIENSIRQRLYTLDDDVQVVCGHGPNTLIGEEKRSNPFVRSPR